MTQAEKAKNMRMRYDLLTLEARRLEDTIRRDGRNMPVERCMELNARLVRVNEERARLRAALRLIEGLPANKPQAHKRADNIRFDWLDGLIYVGLLALVGSLALAGCAAVFAVRF